MTLRRRIARFRAWQHHPFSYAKLNGSQLRHCENCGTDFDGNFCPVCGQKAGVGRVTWKTVRQGITLLWGMDSRSLSYTLLQLLGRPGYLIRDYISGRRQVAFPPVKMLLLVAIAYMLVEYLLKKLTGVHVAETLKDGEDLIVIVALDQWSTNNPGWGAMMYCGLFLLPTWLLFRFAPGYPKHTLPEGFFIQVFMGTLMLFVILIGDLTNDLVFLIGLICCYIVAYRQLFGYGWWGTIWRVLLTFVESQVCVQTFAYAYEYIVTHAPVNAEHTLGHELLVFAIIEVLNAALLIVAYNIGKRSSRKR